jgi:glutamate 5-kinase
LAHVKVKADLLVLLTDVEGLLTKHPKEGDGQLIERVERINAQIERLALGTPGTDRGTGGMQTKIQAARRATENGVAMIIASGHKRGVLTAAASGKPVGTYFSPRR